MNFIFRPFPLPVHCFGLSETLVTQSFRFSGLILYVSHLFLFSFHSILASQPLPLVGNSLNFPSSASAFFILFFK